MEIQCQGKASEIYTKLRAKLEDYKKQGKLAQVNHIDFDDAACAALATGTGFKAKIKCLDGKVAVDLELNFLLKAMRGQIEEGIHKTLSRVLG